MSTGIELQIDTFYPKTRSLRIAVVTETYPPDINGVAHTIFKVVEGLRARGHELVLVRPRNSPHHAPASAAGFQEVLVRGAPIPVYRELKMGLPSRAALQRLWMHRRPDLVHIATEGPLGWSASRIAAKLKIPSTSDFRTNFHAYSQFYGFGWLKGAIMAYMRKFHNATGCTMVPTQELYDTLGGIGFKHLQIVPRGVDTESFSPTLRSVRLRQQWGADEHTVVMLSVGRLAAEKNLDLVLRSYRAVKAGGAKVRLVLVGDGPLRSSLQTQCPEAVFAGTRLGNDLAEHYASGDVFVFPSLTETFGNVTIEAMASGLAVVAYQCAAAGQLIRNDENGLLVAPSDETAFIEKVVWLVRNSLATERFKKAARKTAVAHDWSSVIQRTEAIMSTVASGGIATITRLSNTPTPSTVSSRI